MSVAMLMELVSLVAQRYDDVVADLLVAVVMTAAKGVALAALVRLAIWAFLP